MKKKATKENFKIVDSERVELEPNQEKTIILRFCSQKEVKMTTNKQNTDIIAEILEGKTLEVFKPIPINVAVNAVFSKYAINPHKNINFGPISFFDTKTRTFDIKNEG